MVLCIPCFHALPRTHVSALQDGGNSGAELTQLTVGQPPLRTMAQRDAARLRSSPGGPAGACLIVIPGSGMTLGKDMFVVTVWRRLGHHVPADVAPPSCKGSAGVAAEAGHAMVHEKVAKMTQMRHDCPANALCLVVSTCSCESAAEPRYRALASKKGMVERQRRADIVAVLPRLELASVDVVVAHASAKAYASQDAKKWWTAARAEQTKRMRTRKDVPDYTAFRFAPFAVEPCGYMGPEAVNFVNIAAESGRILKGAFVCLAMQLLSVTLQWGNAEMYRRSGLIISREQGLRYDASFAVPALMS